MGFNIKTTELLILSKAFGADFDDVVTIGRQRMHGSRYLFERLFQKYGFSVIDLNKIVTQNDRYSERFLELLGAKKIDSIDASAYEGATIIHDMNDPISDIYKNVYSTVIDSGSLEHVFNFPVAIKNCMEMVKQGGHFIGITPANNFLGHGFYQFSPELFYRVLSSDNGFHVEKMFLFFNEYRSPVYEVIDPLEVKDRVKLKNVRESYLFTIARKEKIIPIFSKMPQQSDYYFVTWQEKPTSHKDHKVISVLKKVTPKSAIVLALYFRRKYFQFRSLLTPTGDGNKNYFKRIKLTKYTKTRD